MYSQVKLAHVLRHDNAWRGSGWRGHTRSGFFWWTGAASRPVPRVSGMSKASLVSLVITYVPKRVQVRSDGVGPRTWHGDGLGFQRGSTALDGLRRHVFW